MLNKAGFSGGCRAHPAGRAGRFRCFEHSVANMYFIPYGIILAKTSAFMNSPAVSGVLEYDPSLFTPANFALNNLLPVTLGNIVGGSILVGAIYWMIYLRGTKTGE